jgi:hypothetical protein
VEASAMNRRTAEEKARQVASTIFSDGTMRTMLYERILDAFCPTPEVAPALRCRECGCTDGMHYGHCSKHDEG